MDENSLKFRNYLSRKDRVKLSECVAFSFALTTLPLPRDLSETANGQNAPEAEGFESLVDSSATATTSPSSRGQLGVAKSLSPNPGVPVVTIQASASPNSFFVDPCAVTAAPPKIGATQIATTAQGTEADQQRTVGNQPVAVTQVQATHAVSTIGPQATIGQRETTDHRAEQQTQLGAETAHVQASPERKPIAPSFSDNLAETLLLAHLLKPSQLYRSSNNDDDGFFQDIESTQEGGWPFRFVRTLVVPPAYAVVTRINVSHATAPEELEICIRLSLLDPALSLLNGLIGRVFTPSSDMFLPNTPTVARSIRGLKYWVVSLDPNQKGAVRLYVAKKRRLAEAHAYSVRKTFAAHFLPKMYERFARRHLGVPQKERQGWSVSYWRIRPSDLECRDAKYYRSIGVTKKLFSSLDSARNFANDLWECRVPGAVATPLPSKPAVLRTFSHDSRICAKHFFNLIRRVLHLTRASLLESESRARSLMKREDRLGGTLDILQWAATHPEDCRPFIDCRPPVASDLLERQRAPVEVGQHFDSAENCVRALYAVAPDDPACAYSLLRSSPSRKLSFRLKQNGFLKSDNTFSTTLARRLNPSWRFLESRKWQKLLASMKARRR